MTIELYEWADDGGPGGGREVWQCRVGSDGQHREVRRPDSETAWAPLPKSYIQVGANCYAKYWRYCVHAPGDPLFEI